MPDQHEPAPPGENTNPPEQSRPSGNQFDDLIADLPEATRKALRDENARLHGIIRSSRSRVAELTPKAVEFDKLQEAQKSEQQKAAEAIARLEGERDSARTALLRFEVLAKFPGLQAGDAAFLTGATREELEASAERLLARIQAAQAPEQPPAPHRGQPDPGQGRNGQGAPVDGNAWLRGQLRHR